MFRFSKSHPAGESAEARAATYLEQRGVHIVARNWRCRFGEIDLIGQQGDTLVFVEVRERGSGAFGGALASITPSKLAKLKRACELYLASLASVPPCRIDAVLLQGDTDIEWMQGIG